MEKLISTDMMNKMLKIKAWVKISITMD